MPHAIDKKAFSLDLQVRDCHHDSTSNFFLTIFMRLCIIWIFYANFAENMKS